MTEQELEINDKKAVARVLGKHEAAGHKIITPSIGKKIYVHNTEDIYDELTVVKIRVVPRTYFPHNKKMRELFNIDETQYYLPEHKIETLKKQGFTPVCIKTDFSFHNDFAEFRYNKIRYEDRLYYIVENEEPNGFIDEGIKGVVSTDTFNTFKDFYNDD